MDKQIVNQRLEGESFEDYKKRRKAAVRAIRDYLSGNMTPLIRHRLDENGNFVGQTYKKNVTR